MGMLDDLTLHDVDVRGFMDALDACEGNVYLVTEEGDRLNLKSKLSQMMGLMTLIQGGRLLEAKLECDKPEDASRLFRMNLFGNAEA